MTESSNGRRSKFNPAPHGPAWIGWHRGGLLLARILVSAWLGAAFLFVVVTVREVTSPALPSDVKNVLIALRFPAYYLMGAVALTLSLLGTQLARHGLLSRKRRFWSTTLLLTALIFLAVDYFTIYSPLVEMIKPTDVARPAEFDGYHQANWIVNLLEWVLVWGAAIMIGLPSAMELGLRVDDEDDDGGLGVD